MVSLILSIIQNQIFDNVVELFSNSAPSSPRKGNFTNDQRVIHDVLMMSFVDTVPTDNIEESNTSGHNCISMHKRKHLDHKWMAEALDMPRSTLNRKIAQALSNKGKPVTSGTNNTFSISLKRCTFSKAPPFYSNLSSSPSLYGTAVISARFVL